MHELDTMLGNMDCRRLAVPQDDGYDTDVILQLVTESRMPLRDHVYRRRPIGEDTAFCDGSVAIRPTASTGGMNSARLVPAAPNHENLPKAAAFLARWPTAYEQFKRLIDTVYPYSDIQQAKAGAAAFGSSSHTFEDDFGSIMITVDDPLGSAQAMVHEMAHHKLRALGIFIESADRFILNPSDQLLKSPIRTDKSRPMTAVFHAQYSFMHVTALDLFMLEQCHDTHERTRILMLLGRNVIRMTAGYEQIAENIKTDSLGRIFVDSFMDWSEKILETGHTILDENGYGNA